MDFNNEIKTIGKDIYEKVSAFVEANKELDDAVYQGAILNLNDGRKMYVPFANNIESGKVKIYNYQWNEELQSGSGEKFWISAESDHGFLVSITIFNLNKDDLFFTVADDNAFQIELSEEDKNIIKNYMTKLQEQIPTLEYDKEATRSENNFTFEAKRGHIIQKYNNEMKNLMETDPTARILPSVQTAVDWWVERLIDSKVGGSIGNDKDSAQMMALATAHKLFIQSQKINVGQLGLFKDLLSNKIMNRLKRGFEVELSADYGPIGILREALEEAGIADSKTSFKTLMKVNVDSVIVQEGLGAEVKEIFKTPEEEVKHKM